MPKKLEKQAVEVKPTLVQITLVKSPIGYQMSQRGTLRALGLRRINQTVEHSDSPTLRGMIDSVRHLVEVIEVEES